MDGPPERHPQPQGPDPPSAAAHGEKWRKQKGVVKSAGHDGRAHAHRRQPGREDDGDDCAEIGRGGQTRCDHPVSGAEQVHGHDAEEGGDSTECGLGTSQPGAAGWVERRCCAQGSG